MALAVSSECGKPLKEARAEVDRACQTLLFSSEEAHRLCGEVVPMDASPAGKGRWAMTLREPITVICSKMGWIRAMKGHQPKEAEVKFRDGDEGRFVFRAETTDRILVAGSNGRFYTLLGANLPGGRGMGEAPN